MKRLVGNVSVQVKGAEMLQTLIKEEPQVDREANDGSKFIGAVFCAAHRARGMFNKGINCENQMNASTKQRQDRPIRLAFSIGLREPETCHLVLTSPTTGCVLSSKKARHELDGIKGGWQWLCQGTPGGNAIIRYAPGEKHIPGWTVCEEERLTTEEALATAAAAASDWTPYSLATFMGTMRNQHKLQIGNLAYYHFFRVVAEAGLLPHVHEDVEEWRERMRRYEDERHIQVGNITRRRLARDKIGAHVRSLGASSQASI